MSRRQWTKDQRRPLNCTKLRYLGLKVRHVETGMTFDLVEDAARHFGLSHMQVRHSAFKRMQGLPAVGTRGKKPPEGMTFEYVKSEGEDKKS